MDRLSSATRLEVLDRERAAGVVSVSAEAAEPLSGDLVHLRGRRCGPRKAYMGQHQAPQCLRTALQVVDSMIVLVLITVCNAEHYHSGYRAARVGRLLDDRCDAAQQRLWSLRTPRSSS